MKRRARETRMFERRFDCWLREFESVSDRQSRRRRGHRGSRHGDNCADGAEIILVLVLFGTLRRKLLMGGCNLRRSLRCDGVDVTERQRKLNEQREKCRPRTKPDIRPYPLHLETPPHVAASSPRRPRRYNITSQATCLCVNRARRKTRFMFEVARRLNAAISVLRGSMWRRMLRAATAGRSIRQRREGRRRPSRRLHRAS